MQASRVMWLACAMLAGCSDGTPDDEVNVPLASSIPRIGSLQEALGTSQIPTLDPHTMNDAEITKVVGAAPFCAFRYVSDGKPVLAWRTQPAADAADAVVKLNGVLVELQHDADATKARFVADDLHMDVVPSDADGRDRPDGRPREAKLIFQIGQQLRVGYSGYLVCPPL